METTKKTKIIFTGGGSLGHVTPLVSIFHYFGTENYNYMWLWERDSFESECAEKYQIDFHEISAGKIRRYFDWKNFYEPLKNLTGIFEAWYYMLRYKGDIIISKWGYVALPVCIAGYILRKKIYIHESDCVMWLTNRICSRLATKVFTSFDLKNTKTLHTGHIMNPLMLDGLESISKKENTRLQILVIAGSQWSVKICETLEKILPDCQEIDFHILTGNINNQDLLDSLWKFTNTKLYTQLPQEELALLYVQSDIAITRGSSTLWELMYFGIHSIIIPHKYTGGNHQQKNAEYFQKTYGSDILDEDDQLELELFRKLNSYKNLRKSGLNLEGYLDGVKNIEKEIL